jgi:transcriptional regulator with XRE-family HTH domain
MLGQKGISQFQINLRFGQISIQKISGEIEFKTIVSNQELAERAGLTQSKLASLENASRAGGEKSVT